MNQQRWMDILASHDGSALLNTVVGNFQNFDSDDDTHVQVLFELFKRMHTYIGKPIGTYKPKPNCLLKPEPLRAMPPEVYRRLTKLRRRQLYFKQLERRDILYLQVLNTDNPESYKCLVLAKHGDLTILDDLSLVVHFPKLDPELETLKADLQKFDLIRGAFWSCAVWDRKFFVTLDTQIFSEEEKEKIPKLGKITRKELPYYVRSVKVGMTYAGYVQRSKGYKEEGYCMNKLQECLGIDTNRIHSFFKEWDGKTYPASEHFAEVRKKLIPDNSTKRLHKSFEYFRNGNMFKALYYANKAIAFNPDNIQARVTRGTVYANLGKMRKAFIDTLDSLKLDWKHEAASKQMAELLVTASKTHFNKKNYLKWYEYLRMATKYNPNNREVQELLSCARFATPLTGGAPYPVQPSLLKVIDVYGRLFDDDGKRRRLKMFRKLRKRKRKQQRRRRRAQRQRAKRSMIPQPIPTTSTSRRQVYFRPNSPVFRRPFPPRNTNPRS